VVFAAMLALAASLARAQTDLSALEQRIIDLHRRIATAVVRVNILSDDVSEGGLPTKWTFSGFFIDREGRVVTNIGSQGAISRAWIEKDGLSYLAEVIGTDPRTNLALLQLVKLPEKFGIVPIPESDEPLPIGSFALGVTHPLELDPSPTLGLITGYESSFASVVFPFTYTRVNLPAGPGEGGSPIVDLEGRLVGVSVASVPDVRSSYLVPSRALARVVADLLTTGRVAYGSLPVEFAERPDPSNLVRHVVVASVVADSSAARADVRVGDVVRLLGASTVRRIHDVRDALFFSRPGQFISLEVERDGRRIPFALPVDVASGPTAPKAAERPSAQPLPAAPPGTTLAPPTRPGAGD
jgi:S1-C subfamily serine protease